MSDDDLRPERSRRGGRPGRVRPGAVRVGALAVVLVGTALLFACTADDGADDGSEGGGATTTMPTLVERQGGMTTTFDDSDTAFTHPARSLGLDELRAFRAGDATFESSFTPPDLGEGFDAVGCTSCHVNDGRAPGPTGDGPLPEGLIARIETEDPVAIDAYGPQLQQGATRSIAEAQVEVFFQEIDGEYDDGTTYSLREPTYVVHEAGPALPADTVLSVRTAPPLIGLGLLEEIPVEDLLAHADPADRDGDGISGRAGEASVPFEDQPVLGRFGWQASAATVEHQTALALIQDSGITTSWFSDVGCQQSGPCPPAAGPVPRNDYENGDGQPSPPPSRIDVELGDREFIDLVIYTIAVAVPAQRDVEDPEVRAGAALFDEVGCTSCHAGPFTTGDSEITGLRAQVIDPGTDLLLYDMGDGLADRTLAGDVVNTEWRSAPLWGLGLAEVVAGRPVGYLHDGRARSIEEAILWHGGEAGPAAARFRSLPTTDRNALLAYLHSR